MSANYREIDSATAARSEDYWKINVAAIKDMNFS